MNKIFSAAIVGAVGFVAVAGMSNDASASETRSMNPGGPSVSWCDTGINGGGSLCGSLAPYVGYYGFTIRATSTSGWWFTSAQYYCTGDGTLRGFNSPNRYNGSGSNSVRCPTGRGTLGLVVGLLEDI